MEPLTSKIRRRLRYYLNWPKIYFQAQVGNKKELAKLAGLIKDNAQAALQTRDLANVVEILSSFRVTTPSRKEIMQVTMENTLRHLRNSGVSLKILDSSPEEYIAQNQSFYEQLGLKLSYRTSSAKLTAAYIDLLTYSDKPYFYMAFDDFVSLNMQPQFLNSAAQLLKDFAGLVDCILIDPPTAYRVDDQEKIFYYDLNSLDALRKADSLLGIVNYGNWRFAIVRNFHYGFFFNTIVANRQDYLRRLTWYVNNVSPSAHYIELAAAKKIGPVYKFLAIPLDVVQLDLDFEHTQISVRAENTATEDFFRALKNNYRLIANK